MAEYYCPRCGSQRGTTSGSCWRCSTPLREVIAPPVVEMVQPQDAPAVRGNYARPIVSDAMGFVADPADVAEHRRRFPNVDLVIEDGCARPVLRSLGQKRQYLDAMGWADTKDFR
jgi:hypothetical protein